METIDVHAHFFPDEIAAKAVPAMEGTSGWKTHHDGTLAGLIKSMDAAGIAVSVILPVATNPHKTGSINRFSASVDNERVVMAGALHPASPVWRDDIEEMLSLGFRSVKLHPDYQEFFVDSPEWRPFFGSLRDAGVTVIFHAGEDPSYREPFKATPSRIARLLDSVPGLRVVASHFGGFRYWDEVEQCLVGREDVALETSYSFGFLPDERISSMILAHGTDRVMFGTDSPWLDQAEEVGNVLRLDLGDEVTEKILCGNARRMLDEWQHAAAAHNR